MRQTRIFVVAITAFCAAAVIQAQSTTSCAKLVDLRMDGVEITKAALIPAGATVPPPYPGAPSYKGALPAHCRVDGVTNRRKGADGPEFGIGFALALPEQEAWNGDFLMQGGGGGNGVVAYPMGAAYSGDKPALVRGFAVASTDTGHKAKTGPFDFSFMRDQQAYLDFAYLANAEVAGVVKKIIAQFYTKPASYSYFVGCSTGGREGDLAAEALPGDGRACGGRPASAGAAGRDTDSRAVGGRRNGLGLGRREGPGGRGPGGRTEIGGRRRAAKGGSGPPEALRRRPEALHRGACRVRIKQMLPFLPKRFGS